MWREIWTEIVSILGKFLFEYSFLLIKVYQLQSGIELVLQSSRARSINSGRPKPTASFLSLYNYGPQSPGRKGFWPRGFRPRGFKPIGFSSVLFVLRRRTSSSTSAIVLSRCGCSEVCGRFSSILSEMGSTSCLFFSDFPPTLFIIHFSGGSLKFVMMFSWMSYLHACHLSSCF